MEKYNKILYNHIIKKLHDTPKKIHKQLPTIPKLLSLTKFCPIKYEEPLTKDMGIILVYFNPTKSNRIIQNILFVKHSLEICNIPFYIADLAFNDEPFLFNSCNNIFQYRTSSYMFYKENLIYCVLQFLPDTITKICTVDADIMFDNPKWYEITSNTLNTYNVCQPFNLAHKLKVDFTIENTSYSCIDSDSNCCSGYAWAFNREWFLKNGFFEYAFIGGGDGLFFRYITTYKQSAIYNANIYKNEYIKYLDTRENLPPVCSLNLNIYHLFHGMTCNRQYSSRHELFNIKINSLNLNNLSELFIRRDDNIIEWNPKYINEMNSFMKTYFMNRQDDSV